MTRRRKFLTVGAILAVGLVLAWPFRRIDVNTEPTEATVEPHAEMPRASNGDPIAAFQPEKLLRNMPVALASTAAQLSSAGSTIEKAKSPDKLEAFDIAFHPALSGSALPENTKAVSRSAGDASLIAQPAYSTVTTPTASANEWPAELLHVVTDGDTLEKLALRYLKDAGKALEIFDLNRDLISNPHLLPIGVQLRVPQDPNRIVD